jgi:uncharacterized protein (TIGR00369 family)
MGLADTERLPTEIDKDQYLKQTAEAAENTFWGFIGCRLEKTEDGKVTASLDIKPHHLNNAGIVHGGVLTSMLDNAMGAAALMARPFEKVVTTNLNVHFVTSLREGKMLATGEVIHQTNKTLTLYGTITGENGELSAMGTGTFRVI